MFLQITTQVRENYNFEDNTQPYWKFKGGSSYVLDIGEDYRGFSVAPVLAELAPLISHIGGGFEEYITGVKFIETAREGLDTWETLHTLTKTGDTWSVEAEEMDEHGYDDEHGYTFKPRKTASWDLLPNLQRANFEPYP